MYSAVTDYRSYWQPCNFLPVSAILHLYKILLTILSKACHSKFGFKYQLNSSCVYDYDPDAFVVNSRVGWKCAHKCVILVTSVGAQYACISTWRCVKITNQEKHYKIRLEPKWKVQMLTPQTFPGKMHQNANFKAKLGVCCKLCCELVKWL